MKHYHLTRKFAVIVAFACVSFAALPANAGNEFKNGFEDQIGRLLAFQAFNVGRAILAPPIYGPGYPGVYPGPYPGPYPGGYGPPMPRGNPYYSCQYGDPYVMQFCVNRYYRNRYGPPYGRPY